MEKSCETGLKFSHMDGPGGVGSRVSFWFYVGSCWVTYDMVRVKKTPRCVAVVQHYDSFQVRIHQLTPDLTDVGTSLDEAKTLRHEHQDLTTKLYVSIRHSVLSEQMGGE